MSGLLRDCFVKGVRKNAFGKFCLLRVLYRSYYCSGFSYNESLVLYSKGVQ